VKVRHGGQGRVFAQRAAVGIGIGIGIGIAVADGGAADAAPAEWPQVLHVHAAAAVTVKRRAMAVHGCRELSGVVGAMPWFRRGVQVRQK
jgi:hypothetical protein